MADFRTEGEFRDALAKKGQAVTAARLSLDQRVREFVGKHCRNGGKGGRADYSKMIGLDEFEPMRVALDEYDRVAALPLDAFATTEQETPDA